MKKAAVVMVVGMVAGLILANPGKGAGTREADFITFLKEYEARIITLSRENNLASFEATISGRESDYEKSAQSQMAIEKIYLDTATFGQILAFREGGRISEPLLKRQLDILYLSFLGNQIDPGLLEEMVGRQTAIERKFNTFRVKLGERELSDNEVDSILQNSTDSEELETVWKASKLIGREVAGDIVQLAKLRNRAAHSLGFTNFYEMQIKLGEEEPSEIAALFNQLDSLTGGVFAARKMQIDSALAIRFGVDRNALQPWHYRGRFFQEVPSIYDVDMDAFYRDKDPVALAKAYFAGIGLPVDSILIRSDLYEKSGKYQHAESYDIDRSGDIRIICNVRPDYSWTGTMLHELGHAVHDYYCDLRLPWLLRSPAHSFTTEAVANFFGRLAGNPRWMVQVAGVSRSVVDSAAERIIRTQHLEQLIFCRWSQVMIHFERALYENPDQDLNKLWWDLVEKYQGLTRPAGRNEPDWAAKIHIAIYPVYYHNYLMGELLASQIAETIGRKVMNSGDPFDEAFAGDERIGKYFKENIFEPGSRYRWDEMIERSTGEKLNSVHYVRQFIQ